MDPRARPPLAGGCLMTAAILTGTIAGLALGQPSIGFLAGVGAGLVLVGLIWLLDRRK